MRLTLKNFKCWALKTFEFKDETITLIHGPSGHGKSSILLAIEFVLYGGSNHKFLISHNKNTCEVNLEYKNFKIKRTKRPNILTLYVDEKLYEDKEAQVIINKYFGYNYGSKFMDLSSLEKLEFLEKIVAEDYDIKELKLKLKNQISTINKDLALLDGQILNAESMLKIIKKPNKVEKPPSDEISMLDDTNLDTACLILEKEKAISDLKEMNLNKEKFNTFMVKINLLNEELNVLGTVQSYHSINQDIKILKDNLQQLQEKNTYMSMVKETIKELEKYKNIKDEDKIKLINEIKMLDTMIEKCLKFKDYNNYKKLEEDYEALRNQEMIEWKNKVDSINKNVEEIFYKNMDDLNHLEKIRVTYENYKAFNLKNNLSTIEKEMEILKIKFFKSYSCVKCNHKFLINMNTLEMIDDIPSNTLLCSNENKAVQQNNDFFKVKKSLKDLEMLKDNIIQNESFMAKTNIENVIEQINQIKLYISLTEKLNNLKIFKPSNFLQQMNERLLSLRQKFLEYDEIDSLYEDDCVLKDKKRDLTIKLNNLINALNIKNNLKQRILNQVDYDENEHTSIQLNIEESTNLLNLKYLELEKVKTFERIKGQLDHVKEEIKSLNYNDTIIPQLEQKLSNLNLKYEYCIKFLEYKNFQINLKKYKKVKETIKTLQIKKQSNEQMYFKNLLFKQKVAEAENESLQSIINIVNSHLDVLLNDFFSEHFGDPIQIYLTIENQSNSKPQINTIINYKGNRVDYKSLSTGEYSRVKLAFDLTFKEILGESIIMLDECTANLDQDLSTKIFNKIKATFPSKTILVVAHQVVMGAFDHILSL